VKDYKFRFYKNILLMLVTLSAIILFNCGVNIFLAENIILPAIFSNNMVIQRDQSIPVWGKADPGGYIKVKFAGQTAETRVGKNGKWKVKLDPISAGGPHTMQIIGKDTLAFANVLVGEVWLCSGQSNMEWSVRNSNKAQEEIDNANYDQIRLCKVEHTVADSPQFTFSGDWKSCKPENIPDFSAVGYFFGRYLHKKLDMPIGLIQSTWGGTPAESWTSTSTLKSDSVLAPIVNRYQKNIENYSEKIQKYRRIVKEIKEKNKSLPMYQEDPGNQGYEKGWSKLDFDDSNWKGCNLPGFWENWGNMKIDGAVWFRKKVTIPESWDAQKLVVSLGPIDDFDVVYFNGQKIGQTGEETPSFWTYLRKYTVPAKFVEGGKAVVAVRVFDHFGQGGFAGASSQMKLYPRSKEKSIEESISLADTWKYKVEKALDPALVVGPGGGKYPPEPIDPDHPHTPAGLYNGMIRPIAPFAIKGAVWYQGEANANRAYQYRTLLPAMIRDWRKLWDQENYYFGIVQLANYMAVNHNPQKSAWAELREAQTMTADNLKNCGLAVTIDIGDADDIHPRNKQEVGKRLGLWALAAAYDRNIVYSGPKFKDMNIIDNKIEIIFDYIAEGLKVQGNDLKGFAIAGEDQQFKWAKAKIEGNTVTVWSEEIENPVAVRYAWANNPVCNLYNSAGLPAIPFRTDDWKGVTIDKR